MGDALCFTSSWMDELGDFTNRRPKATTFDELMRSEIIELGNKRIRESGKENVEKEFVKLAEPYKMNLDNIQEIGQILNKSLGLVKLREMRGRSHEAFRKSM